MSAVRPAVLPPVVEQYWYSVDWNVEELWALDLPVESMALADLIWHLDVPIWPFEGVGYRITPRQVVEHPDIYGEEHARLMAADMSWPIEVWFHTDRWMVLDGVHRLARAWMQGTNRIPVRRVPDTAMVRLTSPGASGA